MRTYSIHCETCGDILEYGSPGTIAAYAVTHKTECPGEQRELPQQVENHHNTVNPRKVERFIEDCDLCNWSTPPLQTLYEVSTALRDHSKIEHR